MPTFEIKYTKKLCDDSGHEHDTCQSVTTVEAPTAHDALRLAEAEVCRSRHLSDWTIFADAIELRALSPAIGAPSRINMTRDMMRRLLG